ncbi:MAG: AAA family ATPase [Vampirovibrionales bacterium]|nr:AAA family ATPase [Vampirovibrionales bacterium]
MILNLRLENIAIIERLELTFRSGLTIITGEAGSGKSLLLDALAWALGASLTPKDVLRHGSTQGRVELTLELTPAQRRYLSAQLALDLDDEENEQSQWVFSREITPAGSRCRVNGTLVQRKALEPCFDLLLLMQGQHAAVGLFQPVRQRAMLDQSGGRKTLDQVQAVSEAYKRWQSAEQAYQEAQALFKNQVQQAIQNQEAMETIAAAMPMDPHEDERLQLERKRLSNQDKLLQGAAVARHRLMQEPSEGSGGAQGALVALSSALKKLSEMTVLDEALSPLLEQASQAEDLLRDVARQLQTYVETMDRSSEAIQTVVDRLDLLDRLKRRFGATLTDVLAYYEQLQARNISPEALEAELCMLNKSRDAARQSLQGELDTLSQYRQHAAEALSEELSGQLQALAMPSARFDIVLSATEFGALGQERVSFCFSANAGEPPKPIHQVASGGELSRILLALSLQLHDKSAMDCPPNAVMAPCAVVFDEIDAGTSGVTARAIAERLMQLAQRQQTLVITHQPIIAAAADWHLHLEKEVNADQNRTGVAARWLSEQNHQEAILARLASGEVSTNGEMHQAPREYAAQLMRRMQEAKALSTSSCCEPSLREAVT